ncbi:ATP-binding protein [Pedobacter sp. BS3]|uniref:ATP-binding protein n=1 Tax=Pedobacter sp. BS3 TaxID=2567937 RepID=UPI0011F059A7|nr:ATP-binding protein [Pedobacter sp. BS3]TZF82215.1 ATP-binding protein [Pedobacter sp. BS3]
MIARKLTKQITLMATKMPVISITGPRQSGKTTLAKQCFPQYTYVNLENPDTFDEAKSDPRLFLTQHKEGLIIDEVQLIPELFSYIQTLSDERNKPGEYILTGSQNFLLSAKISQSLAGRVFITHLLPFSLSELKNTEYWIENPDYFILKGFYPRIYDKDIPVDLYYPSYIQTYAERDVRQLVNVSNLHLFQKFMRLAAGRIGQLLNYNSMANELGVDLKTVKSWFSILETSFIAFFLQPHFRNFSKRLVKTPKLYFYDTGLACSLLGIKKEDDLNSHWAKGALFENLVIVDIAKNYLNNAQNPPLFFWRDNTGNELDCLIDEGLTVKSIEIKSATTLNNEFFKNLNYYNKLSGNDSENTFLLYGGNKNGTRKEAKVLSWKNTNEIGAD